jgi:hypothetical protein
MNGTTPPIIRGRLYTSEDPTAKVVIDRFKKSGADGFCVTFPTPAYRDFRPITLFPSYEVRYYEGYGVAIRDEQCNSNHYDEVLAALAGDQKGLKWVAHAGIGEDFSGTPFSWEDIASAVAKNK